ncbi:GrpB family protein [candidate division WOR-3 bacterium]|nr:GrpB family protein [candidate division WOR-3 bacterium]
MKGVSNTVSIGLKRGTLELVQYDPEWELFFDSEKKRIEKSIGKFIIAIEHIGSTSIKDMCAKPIIDIAIGLEKYDDGFECVGSLKDIGYLYLGEYGISERHYFRTDSDIVKCHIHMYEISNKEYRNHILFRDYLRSHKEDAKKYALLKHDLTQTFGNDREKYTEAKTKFINNTSKKAKESN